MQIIPFGISRFDNAVITAAPVPVSIIAALTLLKATDALIPVLAVISVIGEDDAIRNLRDV
jgi:hypothetical protein